MKYSKHIYPLFFIVLVPFYINSCQTDTEQNVISQDKMVQLLIHTHILEAKMSNSYLPGDSAIQYFALMQDSIFTHFDVDSAQFHNAIAYYTLHPEILEKIYVQVVDSLALREQLKNIKYK